MVKWFPIKDSPSKAVFIPSHFKSAVSFVDATTTTKPDYERS